MYVIHSIVAALLTAHVAIANVLPSEPSPGTVWTSGKEHVIEWGTDTLAPTLDDDWTNFTIGRCCNMINGYQWGELMAS
ncbi:hypothetical protein K450DRAFT_244207 [Umbelopsis ramanniana AG]|uniref:Uncharacterized protein n=1 Tax=Umbelopsis ramanniana AG TaxID=1314678 RepID=A0AAD5HDH0_UMBRA|nr:uncharacterized protein K450DRAFT_244207 [Umbelopsis ramanniana AG]KAI8578939.1 hypothetical protein K450DRAFT_244207 [Umbelopsis ramanniana AG]